MRKSIAAIMAVFVMLFSFAGLVSAQTSSGKMYKAVEEKVSGDHYDYDKGTLSLNHVKTVHLDQPVDKVNTVQMAVAEYKTVRDHIFFTSHKETVAYDPDHNQILQDKTTARIDAVKSYEHQYGDEASHQGMWDIIIFMLLILLIPGLIAFVWAKRQHSVLSYKLENDLFDGVGDKRYS